MQLKVEGWALLRGFSGGPALGTGFPLLPPVAGMGEETSYSPLSRVQPNLVVGVGGGESLNLQSHIWQPLVNMAIEI